MPNWCENELVVSCKLKDKAVLKKFMEDVKSDNEETDIPYEDLDFDKIVPMPEASDKFCRGDLGTEEKKKFGENNWWDWSIKNWGTKWNAHDVMKQEKTITQTMYAFNTAWSPPEPVVQAASKKYPELKFVLCYWEMGAGFRGRMVCEGGKLISEKTYDYKGNRGG